MSDGPGEAMLALAGELDELAGHVAQVQQEVKDFLDAHSSVYDGSSDTGDSTRSMIQGAADEIETQVGVLKQAADNIRDHGNRVIAAQGS